MYGQCAWKMNRDRGRQSGRRGQAGFTLVELLVGMFLASILFAVLGSVLAAGQGVEARIQDQGELQRSGSVALERITQQISLAGLNLDPEQGEEAFPSLPPGAGGPVGDWGKGVAVRSRPEEGSPSRYYAYYVKDGRLVQDDGAGQVVPLTEEGIVVTSLSFKYYTYKYLTDGDVLLNPAKLRTPGWRTLIRRVDVRLELAQAGRTDAEPFVLEEAVTVENLPG